MSEIADRYPKRSAHAARTRAAILAAATELFGVNGYAGTTMKAIAVQAGVSVESVYLVGSKSSLLAAAMTVAFTGQEGDQPLTANPAYAAVFALEDADAALDRYVDLVSASIARSDGLWRTARAAADVEIEIQRVLSEALERRRKDIAMAGPWLVSRGLILPGEVESAVATFSVLVSHEVYEHLVEVFGYSVAGYAGWLRTAIDRLVLDRHLSPTEGKRP